MLGMHVEHNLVCLRLASMRILDDLPDGLAEHHDAEQVLADLLKLHPRDGCVEVDPWQWEQ